MSDDTDVLAAIEMLLEEIETVIETVNSEGSAAFASGKHKERWRCYRVNGLLLLQRRRLDQPDGEAGERRPPGFAGACAPLKRPIAGLSCKPWWRWVARAKSARCWTACES